MDTWEIKKEARKKVGFTILLALLTILGSTAKVAEVPNNAVLKIDFDTTYNETRGDDLLAEFTGDSLYSVYDLIKAVNVAATDDRVKAIAASVNTTSLGLAQIQNIARAVEIFKSSGKEAYIFSSGMGSFGQGTKEYYLASFLPFFKNLLHKFGISPEFYSRYEYKNAAASLTENSISKPYKEELNKLGLGLFNQLTEGIAQNRNLTAEKVKQLINKAPIFADEALNQELVDKLGYQQEMESFLERRYQAKILPIEDYMAGIADYQEDNAPLVAVLTLEGAIDNGISLNTKILKLLLSELTLRGEVIPLPMKFGMLLKGLKPGKACRLLFL